MIPGELVVDAGEITLNANRATLNVKVTNTGDRPVQVGSHYHFAETNTALEFDRSAARGFRLNIAAGTAVRFEPGQSRTIELVALDGARVVYGFNALVMGPLDKKAAKTKAKAQVLRVPSAKKSSKTASNKRTKPRASVSDLVTVRVEPVETHLQRSSHSISQKRFDKLSANGDFQKTKKKQIKGKA